MTLKECRAKLKTCQEEKTTLLGQIAALKGSNTELTDENTSLKSQNADLKSANDALKTESASKDELISEYEARIAQLEQEIADCQAQLPTTPDGEILRDTDGTTMQSAIADLNAGDILNLIGEFDTSAVVNLHKDNFTLRCDPGKAKIIFHGVQDGIRLKITDKKWSRGVKVENLELEGATRSNLVLGNDCQILGVDTHGAGEFGISGNGDGVPGHNALVKGCKIHDNGSVANLGHGSSGSKIFQWDGCVYEGNDIYNNIGNGQWSDHDSANVKNINNRFWGNTRRDIFWEKCGRSTNPYDPTPPFNVVYQGPLTADGCRFLDLQPGGPTRESGYETIGAPASCFGVFKNLIFEDGRQLAILIRNDPNRMEPLASQKPTEPGWYVEGYEVWNSLNTYNGQKVQVGGSPTPPAGAVVYK